MEQIEEVATKVKGNLMTAKEGAMEIMEIIYRNPTRFMLTTLSNDDRVDFLIYQLPSFERLLKIYDKNQGQLSSFIYGNIKFNLVTWNRKRIRKFYENEITVQNEISEYAEKESMWNNYEDQQKQNEEDPQKDLYEIQNFKNRIKASRYAKPKLKSRREQLSDLRQDEKIMELQKQSVLVLLLKSVVFVDDPMIAKASAITGTPVHILEDYLQQARVSIKNKMERIKAVQNSRQNAWIYIKRYSLEQKFTPENSIRFIKLQERIEHLQKIFYEKTELLQSAAMKPCPTNRAIGKILGLDERKVKHIIEKAEQNIDRISLKGYDSFQDLFNQLT